MRLRPALALALLLASGCAREADAPDAAAPDTTGAAPSVEVRDDSTGAELPRISLPGRPEVERRVNAGLDSLSASLACLDAGPDTAGTSFATRAEATHAADDVLSVSVHASYSCGTAYPTNDANLSVTYDLTTGERVPFAALFRDYEADRAAITGVLQTTLYAAGVAGDGGAACADALSAEALAASGFAYSLSSAGLTVQPDFPHVTEACAVESLIPFASVRAYAAEGGPLARVADASTAPAP